MSGDWGYGTLLHTFFWGYLVGGFTLLPALAVLVWHWGTIRVDSERQQAPPAQDLLDSQTKPKASTHGKADDFADPASVLDAEILMKLRKGSHEPDTFAGYFAVCRDYVPGGVNGKPPDRTTPAGAVVPMESPSVYQSMYRSLFDRNKVATPSIDASNIRNKKARNVFYVVLRLGHLMLYDNDDQLEVRHVISLAHYSTDIYAGGDTIPEGELWIKRNCIRLLQKRSSDALVVTKSYFLFSDNCSEKEDFFHAVLQAQEHHQDESTPHMVPDPLKFDTSDLVKLVQQLHASEENLHTRWINALIGRVFLGLYKTSQVKDFIATKITKKIARVPKPALINSVTLRSIDMGTLPPFITNPKLKELTVDGDLVVEADVSYKGNFRVEISAIARIDLGTRFKAREVTLVLASILKRLDGHILIRIKPPPSNRLWITFETSPRMELSVEPVVSSRQITYSVVLRAIESRMREVVNETLVLPNWDDIPFTDTFAQAVRGGIWRNDRRGGEDDLLGAKKEDLTLKKATMDAENLDEKAHSINLPTALSSSIDSEEETHGTSSSTDLKNSTVRPRSLRSGSSAAHVQVDSANASAEIVIDRESLTPTSARSLPLMSPVRSPLRPDTADSVAGIERPPIETLSNLSLSTEADERVPPSMADGAHGRTRSKELTTEEIASAAAAAAAAAAGAHTTKKGTFNQSLNVATAAARNWLASKQNAQLPRKANNAHQRGNSVNIEPMSVGDEDIKDEIVSETTALGAASKSHTEPMGRGQPLPPPGTPLPRPAKPEKRQTWAIPAAASTFANIAKRKAVPTSPAQVGPENRRKEQLHSSVGSSDMSVSQAQVYSHNDESEELHHAVLDHTTMPQPPPATTTTDDARQIARRKSSAASSTSSSTIPPPLPKRRQRHESLTLQSHHRRNSQVARAGEGDAGIAGEGLLIVEAPLLEDGGRSDMRSGERRTEVNVGVDTGFESKEAAFSNM